MFTAPLRVSSMQNVATCSAVAWLGCPVRMMEPLTVPLASVGPIQLRFRLTQLSPAAGHSALVVHERKASIAQTLSTGPPLHVPWPPASTVQI